MGVIWDSLSTVYNGISVLDAFSRTGCIIDRCIFRSVTGYLEKENPHSPNSTRTSDLPITRQFRSSTSMHY